MVEEQQLRVQRGERKKDVGGQTNEEAEGCRSPDTAFLFLISLKSEGHTGLFGGQGRVEETKQEKVKIEHLKDKQRRG